MRKLTQQETYFITELVEKSKMPIVLPKPLNEVYCEDIDDGIN